MAEEKNNAGAWRERAVQNLRAVRLLAAPSPPLVYPGVSRLYYAAFQGVMARLLVHARIHPEARHGEAWMAADALGQGLGAWLQELYRWRKMADYAQAAIDEPRFRLLIGNCEERLRFLGLTENSE